MKKKKDPRMFFSGGFRNFIIVLLLLVTSVAVLDQLTRYSLRTREMSYSAFLTQLEQDNVASVVLRGQDAYGKLKDGSVFETVVAYNQYLWEQLHKHTIDISVSSPSTPLNFWYIFSFLLGLALLGAFWYFIRQARNQSGNSGSNIFSMGKSRARMFMPSTIKETFDSVAGAAEAKEELKDVVDFLKNPQKYKRLGAQMTRGVLLVGEPGNGKTLLAKAVAGEANCPFFSISGSDFIEVFVGVGASRVRDLFSRARKYSPSIIFIDEIDAVGRHRGSGHGGGHDEREQTLNQLLTEMDGFQSSESTIIVLAATNRPDVLDKALLRPGRFDRRVFVPYPDLVSREAILRLHAKNVKVDQEVDLRKIARGTPGFSGADLANIVNEAAINASKYDQETVKVKDFEEARDKIILGKEVKSIIQTPHELEMTAYHEAGHALVNLLLPDLTDPLHKITIIPRGQALGVTHSIPEREKYQTTKNEIRARIMIALGGRAAEELIFGTVTTGAYSDFTHATQLARNMVCLYGMSDSVGLAVYTQGDTSFVYSQAMAEAIDKEVKDLLADLYRQVLEMLRENKDKLSMLAQALLEKETLYANEVYELLAIVPRADHSFSA
jgi:cell division protease FtsH